MLAVKLHRKKKPWLGRGSYLIPIVSWETGRVQIRNWIRILNQSKKRVIPRFRKPVKFITLVKIPDDHPIALYHDWIESRVRREQRLGFEFKPFKDEDKELKKELKDWFDLDPESPGPKLESPELILGEALPQSCIKWTKDIHLLYQKNKKSPKD